MGMDVGEKKGVMAEPNIVPLIDVLLVLIIIFMAITPTVSKGMEALVPQPAPPNAPQNQDLLAKTIVVQVRANGEVLINQELIKWDNLEPRLYDIFKERAEKVAFVKGDDSVEFGQVAKAIDIMREAGIDKVGLMTAKVEAGQ